MRIISGRYCHSIQGGVRFLGVLVVALALMTAGISGAQAASDFSVKAKKYNTYMTFFKGKKGYSILAKHAEQLAKGYPKTVQYKIYNDLRGFYKTYRAPKAVADRPAKVYLHTSNCNDLLKALSGETAGEYKKSKTAIEPLAHFYIKGNRAYQLLPVIAGHDINIVIVKKIWDRDIIRDAYTAPVYKTVAKVLLALQGVDGIAAAAVGDTAVDAPGDIGYEELTEALLGENITFDPREWRAARLGQAMAEADKGHAMYEPGPWFAWNSLKLPSGWRYMDFVGTDGVLYKPQEVLMSLLAKGNLASLSFFSRFANESGGQHAGAWAGLPTQMKAIARAEKEQHSDGGLDLISTLPPASKVFPGAELKPLKGGDSLTDAARHNKAVYNKYYAMGASDPHTRAYQAYNAVEAALTKGAFEDVAFFASEGRMALEQIVEGKPPKKAVQAFTQLSNPKLLPLIRQNIWLESLCSQRQAALGAIDTGQSEVVVKAIMEQTWQNDNNMAWLAVVPRLTRNGDISPQFKLMLQQQLMLNAVWLMVLDNLHHYPGMPTAPAMENLPFALAANMPDHAVKCPVIGFNPAALVDAEADTGGDNVYLHTEIAMLSSDNAGQTIAVDIGLKQRVELHFSGAVEVEGSTKTAASIIASNNQIQCNDRALMGAFIPCGEEAKDHGFACITKETMVFNPKRLMFTDYGTFKVKIKNSGNAAIKGAYVIEIKRETVRPQSAVQPSPFMSISRLYNGK